VRFDPPVLDPLSIQVRFDPPVSRVQHTALVSIVQPLPATSSASKPYKQERWQAWSSELRASLEHELRASELSELRGRLEHVQRLHVVVD